MDVHHELALMGGGEGTGRGDYFSLGSNVGSNGRLSHTDTPPTTALTATTYGAGGLGVIPAEAQAEAQAEGESAINGKRKAVDDAGSPSGKAKHYSSVEGGSGGSGGVRLTDRQTDRLR